MARKHEHFGLNYLEELTILKERDSMCKESRQEFLKFKQKADTIQKDVNKPAFNVTPADLSHKLRPSSCQNSRSPLLHDDTDLPVQWFTLKRLKTDLSPDVSVMEYHKTQHLETLQKKFLKKGYHKLGSSLHKDEKGPVAIASLVGTAKQVSILKKPELPAKSKYGKFVHTKKPLIPQQEVCDIEQLKQKTVRTSSAEIDYSNIMDSSSSEKSFNMPKEMSMPLNSLIELEESYDREISEVSSVKSMVGSLQESRGRKRSKIHEKSLTRSHKKSSTHDSAQKFPTGVAPRSIDEIIASLQSTAPTPSDLRIKELLESVLGHDYYNEKIAVSELD